jgi:hypothetical protein
VLKGRLQSAHEVARTMLVSSKERSKEYYSKSSEKFEIPVGQCVLLFDETVRSGRSKN